MKVFKFGLFDEKFIFMVKKMEVINGVSMVCYESEGVSGGI